MSYRTLVVTAVCLALVAVAVAPAWGATFASQVVSYDTGNNNVEFYGMPGHFYDSPASALGAPDGITGQDAGFPNVLSPFSGAYDLNEIVVIGEEGHLTLRFPNRVLIGGGLEIGVISNAGVVDTSYPNGQAGATASVFGGGTGTVEVSKDGVNWVSLGLATFDMPANYYTDSGQYDSTAGSSPADFGKSFDPAGGLSALNGLSNSQIVALMDGSGGGKWLDLGGTGLDWIEYIRFSVANDNDDFEDLTLTIDAVVINNGAGGQPVPEPATLIVTITGGLALLARRRMRA